jgi:hypothetical protein
VVVEGAIVFFDGDPFLEDGDPLLDDEAPFLADEVTVASPFTVLRAVGVCGACRCVLYAVSVDEDAELMPVE